MPILVAILPIAASGSERLIHAYFKTILPDGAVVIQKTMTQTSTVLDQIQSPNMESVVIQGGLVVALRFLRLAESTVCLF